MTFQFFEYSILTVGSLILRRVGTLTPFSKGLNLKTIMELKRFTLELAIPGHGLADAINTTTNSSPLFLLMDLKLLIELCWDAPCSSSGLQ
ncbi:hypothetical protein RCL_jg23497.t1 [Rhizophagus clarus]|uniref:Uncharacterized protein n=1 Tax=Rhizophagus clarus TaxID=94130 RepID=A0A8H3QKE2_9GLOM|nr:hypothetical protein RCL_jg23497.t1 [Rhizophagus clarus]